MKPSKNPSYQRLLSFLLAFSLILISIAPALIAPVSVYAAGSVGTLKAFLIGLSAMMGVGNIDPASISYMNNNTVLSAPLEDFVGDNPIYTTADLNAALNGNEGVARWTSAFANNAASVKVAKQYITSSGGDPSGLDGLGGASAGENIISSARYGYNNYKTNGNWDLRPSIGGQTMTDAIDATAVMTAMSNYAYNFDQYMQYANNANLTQEERDELWDQGLVFADQNQIEDYLQNRNKTITIGSDINQDNRILNNVGNVNNTVIMYISKQYPLQNVMIDYPNGALPIRFRSDSSGNYTYFIYKYKSNGTGIERSYNFHAYEHKNWNKGSGNTLSYHDSQGVAEGLAAYGFITYENMGWADIDNMINNSINNGTNIDVNRKSPSLIGSQGQLSGTATKDPTTNNYNYNINVNPTANYNTYNYRLPTDEEITTMISEAQTAINQGQTQEDIAEIFNQFAQQIRSERPVPTAPPTVPEQPTEEPKPTLTPEQEGENKEIMATTNLKDKFPFCIPWDIYSMFTKWDSIEREAPHIEAELNLGPAGTHTIDVDFEDYNDVAALLRLLELILFIVGLAVATRSLIGAGGK